MTKPTHVHSIYTRGATKIAHATWQGVYDVQHDEDGWFRVRIHSVDGPVYFISPEGVPHARCRYNGKVYPLVTEIREEE